MIRSIIIHFFFFNDTATTEIYTLSLHDALPISRGRYHGATPYSTGGYTVTDDARKGFLSPRERRTVEAFAEVFIAGQGEALTPREIADNLDAHLVRVRSKRKASVRLLLFLIEDIVPLPALRGPV